MEQLQQIAEQLHNPNRTIRYRAIYKLAKLNDPKAVDLLVKTLDKDDDREIRALAAKLLSKINTQTPIDALIRALKDDRHAQVRRAAAEALGQISWAGPEATDALITALYDRSKHVRRAVIQSIRITENTAAIPGLIGVMLGDMDSYVRWEAVRTLENLAPVSAIPAFAEALAADENSYVRYVAASALGKFHDLDLVMEPLLNALMDDENSYVRFASATALGVLLAETESETLLRQMLLGLNDPNTHVWHAVAESLWAVTDIVFPVVLNAMRDDDPAVQRVALKASLWLTAEFDDNFAPNLADEIDASSWGWWN